MHYHSIITILKVVLRFNFSLDVIFAIRICDKLKYAQIRQNLLIRRDRARNRIRNRAYALAEMEHLSDNDFKRMFRMSR